MTISIKLSDKCTYVIRPTEKFDKTSNVHDLAHSLTGGNFEKVIVKRDTI